MDLAPLVRKILLGGAEATLDIAGTAVLPGAWPILKGALGPVLERLKARLGGEDVTSSTKKAEEAAAAFEADSHLQELLRAKLLSDLDRVVASGEHVDADVQKLMLIVAGNQDLLVQVLGGMNLISKHLEEGVNLSDEAVGKLTRAIAVQAERSRRVARLALREMGPVEMLIRRQVHRLQVRAVELVQEQATDRAADEVEDGLRLVAALLNEAPTDTELLLELGFLYKTAAQVFKAAGQAIEEAEYTKRAEEVFDVFVEDVEGDPESASTMANAVLGLGNIEHQRGDYAAALEKYRLSIRLQPDHPYAWHDIFAANDAIAQSGGAPDTAEMQQAIDHLTAFGHGQPGLGIQHITELQERLNAMLHSRTLPDSLARPGSDAEHPAM
jgi:tetratricopeptide (TPR) repeat protein